MTTTSGTKNIEKKKIYKKRNKNKETKKKKELFMYRGELVWFDCYICCVLCIILWYLLMLMLTFVLSASGMKVKL